MTVLGHVGGVPVEEALAAAPGVAAAVGVGLALVRARLSRRLGLRHDTAGGGGG